MQVGEDPLQPIVGQGLSTEGHVRVQELAQPRPVGFDEQPPALLQQVRQPGAAGGRIIQQPPGVRRYRIARALDQ
jgi:hypothetical protein